MLETLNLAIMLNFSLLLFALGASPGPNNIMLATSSMNHGYKATIPHILGSYTIFMIMEAIAYFGVSIVTSSVWIELALNIFGFLYIFYLGLKVIKHAHDSIKIDERQIMPPMSFKQAFMIQCVNTKAMVVVLSVASVYAPQLTFSWYMIGTMIVEVIIMHTWLLFGKGLAVLLRSELQQYFVNLGFGAMLIIVSIFMLNVDLIKEVFSQYY